MKELINKEITLSMLDKWTLLFLSMFLGGYLLLLAVSGTLTPLHVVSSESMIPTLERGDLIVIRSISSEEVTVGDVIVFNTPSPYPSPIIHRVKSISNYRNTYYFQTQGDNNPLPDRFLVHSSDVIGKLSTYVEIPVLGNFILFLKTTIGIVISFTILGIYIFKNHIVNVAKQVFSYYRNKLSPVFQSRKNVEA
jgi:signal peptidase I